MVTLLPGDCLDVLPTLPAGSVDAVVCDPPYPCIKRAYGYWTEAEWFALMNPVVEECRRILKPTGSAVFILQPNSERVGRMRTWLWEFMAKWGREWGMVQDAYWWNTCAMPRAVKEQLTPAVKACVWLGSANCYRDARAVVRPPASAPHGRDRGMYATASGWRGDGVAPRKRDDARLYAAQSKNGGSWPVNILPIGNGKLAGMNGHPAGTPLALTRWWVRYICPPGGTVLDPFAGSGTTGAACETEGRECVLIERDAGYCGIIRQRLAQPADLFTEAVTCP
jgi:DNA modification methylase